MMEIITCSCNPENLRIFAKSVYKHHRKIDVDILCIDDGASESYFGPDINFIKCDKDFSFSRYINHGIKFTSGDFIVAGDDTRVKTDGLIPKIKERMRKEEDGLVSPGIGGVCSGRINYKERTDYRKIARSEIELDKVSHLPLIFCLVNRYAIYDLDYFLDERFSEGYGYEDVDLGFRLLKNGYDLSACLSLLVEHEKGQQESTWRSRSDWTDKYDKNREIMREKWGEDVV